MKPLPPPDAVEHYEARAADTFRRLNSVAFTDVHARLAPYLPDGPSSILDVGAGSGRDALALAAIGHSVVAAEPARRLRGAAKAVDAGKTVLWIDDRLPHLDGVRRLGRTFDVILCSAVLMHVPVDVLADAFRTMRGLLASDGIIAVTVRAPMADECRDLFHDHCPDGMIRATEAAGLVIVERWRELDVMRGDRSWDGYVMAAA